MSFVNRPTFLFDHPPHLVGIMDAINRAVRRIGILKGLIGLPILKPVNRMRENQAPMAAQIDIRFVSGDQEEITVRLSATGLVVFVQLVQSNIGKSRWMP